MYVKPPQSSCTRPWREGDVTAVISDLSIEVNGVPRHIGDVRAVTNGNSGDASRGEGEREVESEDENVDDRVDDIETPVGRPRRNVRMFPTWLRDFEVG